MGVDLQYLRLNMASGHSLWFMFWVDVNAVAKCCPNNLVEVNERTKPKIY